MPKRTFIKSLSYCGTIYSIPNINKIDSSNVNYFIGKWEIGENKNKLHFQFYAQLNSYPQDARELNKWLGLNIKSCNHYIGYVKGSLDDNIEYVEKNETSLLNVLIDNKVIKSKHIQDMSFNDISQNNFFNNITLSKDMVKFDKRDMIYLENIKYGISRKDEEQQELKNKLDEEIKAIKEANLLDCMKKGKKIKQRVDDDHYTDLFNSFIFDVKNNLSFNDLVLKYSSFFYNKMNVFERLYFLHKPQHKLNTIINNDNIKPFSTKVNDLILSSEDNREILICCDLVQDDISKNATPLTGVGKSQTAKYIYNNAIDQNKKVQIFDSSKKENLAFSIDENIDVVIFDLTKSAKGFTNWDAIECIKNGVIFSGKYQSQTKILNKIPNVVIFCNDIDKDLSAKISVNRLRFINIKNIEGEFDEIKILDDKCYNNFYNKLYPENYNICQLLDENCNENF